MNDQDDLMMMTVFVLVLLWDRGRLVRIFQQFWLNFLLKFNEIGVNLEEI